MPRRPRALGPALDALPRHLRAQDAHAHRHVEALHDPPHGHGHVRGAVRQRLRGQPGDLVAEPQRHPLPRGAEVGPVHVDRAGAGDHRGEGVHAPLNPVQEGRALLERLEHGPLDPEAGGRGGLLHSEGAGIATAQPRARRHTALTTAAAVYPIVLTQFEGQYQALFIRGGGGVLLALRPTHPQKKTWTQNLAAGESNSNKRPLCGTHPDPPPHLVSIPYKQSLDNTVPLLGSHNAPPRGTFRQLQFLSGAPDTHPFSPPRAAWGRCVLTAAAAGVPDGVVTGAQRLSHWGLYCLLLRSFYGFSMT